MPSYTAHYQIASERGLTGTKTLVVTAASQTEAEQAALVTLERFAPGSKLDRVVEVNPRVEYTPSGVPVGPALPYRPCVSFDGSCDMHGGRMMTATTCRTIEVLADVRAERSRQFGRYGTNANLLDGTGPDVQWLRGTGLHPDQATAADIEKGLRRVYEADETETGAPTWRHLVLEELAESLQETDPVKLREEVLQLAALCVSWAEKIDERVEYGQEG